MVLENRIHSDDIGLRDRIVCGDARAAESMLTRARVAFVKVFELLAKKRGGES